MASEGGVAEGFWERWALKGRSSLRRPEPDPHSLWAEGALWSELNRRLLLGRLLTPTWVTLPGFGKMRVYDSHPLPEARPPGLEAAVFLHGLGSSGQLFTLLGSMLASRRRVLLPDLFGFVGESIPLQATPPYSLRAHGESLLSLMDTLHIEAAHLVGLSLGGWLALRLGLTVPERTKSLVLMNPGGLKMRATQVADTLKHLNWDRFHALAPDVMAHTPGAWCPPVLGASRRALFRVLTSPGTRGFLETVSESDFVDNELGVVEPPVLLLWGRKDRFLSPSVPYALARGLPRVSAHFVEGCGHVLALESPMTCYAHIDAFWNTGLVRENAVTRCLRPLFPAHPTTELSKPEARRWFLRVA